MDILPGSGHPAGGLLPTLGDNALNERPPVMRAYAADRETPAFVPHRQGRFLAGTAAQHSPFRQFHRIDAVGEVGVRERTRRYTQGLLRQAGSRVTPRPRAGSPTTPSWMSLLPHIDAKQLPGWIGGAERLRGTDPDRVAPRRTAARRSPTARDRALHVRLYLADPPGFGEKKRVNLSRTPFHSSASVGGAPLRVMFGHRPA
jgi:hypothetical protein